MFLFQTILKSFKNGEKNDKNYCLQDFDGCEKRYENYSYYKNCDIACYGYFILVLFTLFIEGLSLVIEAEHKFYFTKQKLTCIFYSI